MKALIVIEIPEDHFLVTANDLYERLKGYKCDLKPMPQKKEAYASSYTERAYEFSAKTHPLYADGWNDCLMEIEK